MKSNGPAARLSIPRRHLSGEGRFQHLSREPLGGLWETALLQVTVGKAGFLGAGKRLPCAPESHLCPSA